MNLKSKIPSFFNLKNYIIPTGICLFKVDIWSKFTIRAIERLQPRCSGILIANFEQIFTGEQDEIYL